MEQGSFAADLVIYALIAVFILHRLYSVLGRKDSSEDDIISRVEKLTKKSNGTMGDVRAANDDGGKYLQVNTVIEPEQEIKDPNIAGNIEAIKRKDANFRVSTFISGAKMAFEMVIKAFSAGNKDDLKNLLSDEIYKEFVKEIEKFDKEGKKQQITLVAILSASIDSATISGSKVQIEVKFISEQVRIVRDNEGNIIEGNPSAIEKTEDEWTFERDLRSHNPNWTVIAT